MDDALLKDGTLAVLPRKLHTALVGDVMDQMGLRRQFLPPYLRPLRQDMVVVGRALPVLEADLDSDVIAGSSEPIISQPFGLMFRALDDLKPGEIYICTGASRTYALWGELMSVRAMRLGAAGAVVDGFSRDTRGILTLGFPVFSAGSYAQDQGPRGAVVDFRVPIDVGGVKIAPGDIVFGDLDGVVVIPQSVEEEVVRAALNKREVEEQVRSALGAGSSSADTFERFKVM